MPRLRARWYWMICCLAVLLLAAGCFQQSGSPSNVTPISQALPTSTPNPPSDTPEPPPTDTPEEPPTQQPQPTASPTLALDTEEGIGGSVLEVTSPPIEVPTLSTLVAQADIEQQEDPLNITATAIIQRATQTQAANLTATAFALFGTPTPTVGPTLTPVPGVFPTATPGQVIPGGPCTHVVVAGDNLFRISLRYGVPINDIAAANGISNPSLIVVGQVLNIPGCTGGANPPPPSAPGSGTCTTTYTTQQGDTLFQISLQFGVPVNSIAAANNISNINLIFINQQLCIPAA